MPDVRRLGYERQCSSAIRVHDEPEKADPGFQRSVRADPDEPVFALPRHLDDSQK